MKRYHLLLFFALSLLAIISVYIWSKDDVTPFMVANKPIFEYKSERNSSEIVCTSETNMAARMDNSTTKPKVILFYNFPDYYEINKLEGFKQFEACSTKCEVTTNPDKFDDSDAVIFYSHKKFPKNVFHHQKRPRQIFALFTVEPPPYSENEIFGDKMWYGLFNWTMSYRYDSEFWHGYLRTVRKNNPAPANKRNEDMQKWKDEFKKKTKMVAWFVSHCDTNSKREIYVRNLSKYIHVDIFGNCGTLKCERYDTNCLAMLRRDYKFYLAFENSICKDYVTEKLQNVFNLGGVVPVVRGGADYQSYFPDNSVIDTSQFTSAKSLAKYLTDLATNQNAYIKYLQWTWDYEILGPSIHFCELCDRLHNPGRRSCYYKNVYAWWTDHTCQEPKDIWK